MNKKHWKRSFFTIWSGQAVSLLTSAVLQMAIIWYLTEKSGSAFILSMATLAGFLPQAILGTFIGALVDRWDRKLIMIGADLIIAAAGGILAILALTTELPVGVVLFILFIRSVGTAFHAPALSAVTPLLVPEEQLTRCAGYSQSVQSVSYILSPALAALLYSGSGLEAVIWLDIIGAIAACITVAAVTIPRQESSSEKGGQSLLAETLAGYRTLKENRGLFSLLWIGAFFTFVYMPVNALFPLMAMGYFGGTTTHASVVEIAFAGGMLVGGLLLGLWGGFKNRFVSLVLSFLTMGASLVAAGLLPDSAFWAFVICSCVMGLSAPFYNGVHMALIQEKIKPEYLGRVFGLMGSVMSLTMPLGLIVSGLYGDYLGVNRWFALSGLLILVLVPVSCLLPPVRNLEKSQDISAHGK